MSYDLRVWERPVGQADPVSFDEASRILLELERLKPGPNPRFIALAEKMAERYPGQGREASDRHDGEGDGAWVSVPVAGARGCTRAVWAFELPTEDHVGALRFVVESANSLGLTVFDDQLGMAFVPPGRVLPTERADIWEGAKREMAAQPARWTLASARKAMKPHLEVLLESHGFSPVKLPPKSQLDAEYVRATEVGSQSVHMFSRSIYSQPRCTLGVSIRSEAIAEILRTVFPEKGEDYANRHLSFNVGLFHGFSQGDIPVETETDIQRILKMAEEPAFRILDMTRTAADLERVMNDAGLFPLDAKHARDSRSVAELCRRGGFAALISAWLSGNDQFAEIEQYIRQLSEKYAPDLKEREHRELEQVLGYLREHIKRGS